MRRWKRAEVLVFGALCLLSACGKTPPPPPPPPVVDLSIEAGPDINPDASGRPSPVVVRVYQLASASKFEAADFFQLFDKEAATLGNDLVSREEIAISPGQTQKLSLPFKRDAEVLGIAVSFRDIDKAVWRGVAQVPPSGTTPISATISNVNITIVNQRS